MAKRRSTQAPPAVVEGPLPNIAADLQALAVPIGQMNAAPNNARRHVLEKDIPVLMASYQTYGQLKPIVAKRLYQGVENAVIAGNGQLLAAQQLGWTHIAVTWLPDDMPDEQAQDYALVDNRSAELSEWDLEALALQLRDVKARGGDAALEALGWRANEAAPLLAAEWRPATPGHLPGREVAYRAASFSLQQWLVIELAIQRLQARLGDATITEGRCLELIAAEFLGGAEGPAGA